MTKENWNEIHEDFGKPFESPNISLLALISKNYQQKWEREGLTCQDAQEWVSVGFIPYDYREIKGWKNHNFTGRQSQKWINVGAKIDDYEFISWLKNTKNLTPEWITNYK